MKDKELPILPYVAFTKLYGDVQVIKRFEDGRVECKALSKSGFYKKGDKFIIFECDIQKNTDYEEMWLL